MHEPLWILKLERHEAWLRQGKRCAYCFGELTLEQVTADHVVPRIRGGTTMGGNIVAACRDCNYAKGHLSKQQFVKLLKSRERLVSKRPLRRPLTLDLCRAKRRINLAADRACKRIRAYVGLPPVPNARHGAVHRGEGTS